jgi:DNA-binding GntR family transcriptional regulator
VSLEVSPVQARVIVTGAAAAEEAIRDAILQGSLLPGQELRESVLAERLGVSRTPVREALLSLEAAGLVEAPRGRSARVRKRTPEDLMKAYELRAVIEAYAAGQAAQVIQREAIDLLNASCERFEGNLSVDDAGVLVRENQAFHRLIHQNCDNPRLPPIVRQLTEMPLVYSAYAWYSRDRRFRSHKQHVAMTEAFDRRDSTAAADIMHEHIIDAMNSAMEAIAAE